MAGSRTLKLSILGDVDNLNKSLKTAGGDIDSFGDKVGKAGLAIGKAFAAAAAAAGAAAIAIGIEGVKAAIADEKAQTQLALALENATGATTAQIAATEQSILQMSLATGVADDELRPALGRLVRSTGDITQAQDLLSTALDVATATGKPLETVANALGKAYDGNTAALGKLGIGLSAAELKTMSFEQVQSRLSDLFGGAAAANADTYAGKIARVQVAFDEAKETLGSALLPILDKLLQFINVNALPAITAFSNAFSLTEGDGLGRVMNDVAMTIKQVVEPIFKGVKSVFDNVKTAIMNSKQEFSAFWDVVKYIAPLIGRAIGGALKVIGDIAEVLITVFARVLAAIKPLINTAIDGINLVIRGLNLIKPGSDIKFLPKIGEGGSGSVAGFSGTMPNGTAFSTGGTRDQTPAEKAILAASVAESLAFAKAVAAKSQGVTTAQSVAAAASVASTGLTGANISGVNTTTTAGIAAASAPTINLTVNGAIDSEGTARTIVETLNNSYYRGTGGAGALVAV
jgi:phage-related protein